jgi:hypothetical protein
LIEQRQPALAMGDIGRMAPQPAPIEGIEPGGIAPKNSSPTTQRARTVPAWCTAWIISHPNVGLDLNEQKGLKSLGSW